MELFRKTRKKEIKDVNNHHNLEEFVACGEVTGSKLSDAEELIERIRLVLNGMEACNKTIIMYLGDEAVVCYVCQTQKGIVKMTVNKNTFISLLNKNTSKNPTYNIFHIETFLLTSL